jgi:serine phosphatase RsbU (regulator of sigma subunit)
MSTFDKLSAKLASLETDANDSMLLEFYRMLWINGMLLNGNQLAELLPKLETIKRDTPQSNCWFILSKGLLFSFLPNTGNPYEKLTEAIEAFRAINDKNGEGAAQSLLSIYYKNLGQLDKAEECIQNSIANINENEVYIQFLCISYYQAGEMQHLLKDYNAAINYFSTGLKYCISNNGLATRMLSGLGTVYRDNNQLDLAYEYLHKALKQVEGTENFITESKIYSDIGNYYSLKGDFEFSFSFQQKSIEIRKERKMNNPLITNYLELAELFLKQNRLEEALSNALLAEKLSKESNIVIKIYQADQILSTIYEAMGETKLALEYYKKYHLLKDEVFSQESARKIKQISMHHEMETMQQEKELFKLKNVVLKQALDEIGASVRYALRIQEAILPPIDSIKKKLPDSFVLYKPKDIVAGDFYWMEEIGDTILIAAADCTGHGVPGAMVSVVCSNALNRAVKEFNLSDPGLILDKVTDLVIEAFEKSVAEVRDGMDISMLSINKTTQQLKWSGANNSLLYFHNNELTELIADKQPIGKSDNRKPFTTHLIEYKPGTCFYLFTDGYADQFGGAAGKKFMYKQFIKTLAECNKLNAAAQHNTLEAAFNNWKGELEQVDDVCVIGIRI